MIASTPKIAVITKDLITYGIPLLFKPLVKQPSRPLDFALAFRRGIDMVNGKKNRIGLPATNTDKSTISDKGFLSISLSCLGTLGKAFCMTKFIMFLSIGYHFFRIRFTETALLLSSSFGVLKVSCISKFSSVSIFIIPSLVAGFTVRMQTIWAGFIFNESIQRFIKPAFNAVFGYRVYAHN